MTKTSNRRRNILERDRWCWKQNVGPLPAALSKALCTETITLFPDPIDRAEKQPRRQWANTTSVTLTAHTPALLWHRPKENCRFGRREALCSLALLAPQCNLEVSGRKRYKQVHCLTEGFYLLVLDFGAAASLLSPPPCAGGRSSLSAPPPVFITWLGCLHRLQVSWW